MKSSILHSRHFNKKQRGKGSQNNSNESSNNNNSGRNGGRKANNFRGGNQGRGGRGGRGNQGQNNRNDDNQSSGNFIAPALWNQLPQAVREKWRKILQAEKDATQENYGKQFSGSNTNMNNVQSQGSNTPHTSINKEALKQVLENVKPPQQGGQPHTLWNQGQKMQVFQRVNIQVGSQTDDSSESNSLDVNDSSDTPKQGQSDPEEQAQLSFMTNDSKNCPKAHEEPGPNASPSLRVNLTATLCNESEHDKILHHEIENIKARDDKQGKVIYKTWSYHHAV